MFGLEVNDIAFIKRDGVWNVHQLPVSKGIVVPKNLNPSELMKVLVVELQLDGVVHV